MTSTTQSEELGTPVHDHIDQSLNDATARLIREQVRAVMHEEMHGATVQLSTLSSQKPDALPPPAYSSDPASTSHADTRAGEDDLHSEAAHLLASDPQADVEADVETVEAPRRVIARLYWALPGWIRTIILILPFVSVFVLMPVLCLNGDVLALSVIGFFLLLAQLFTVFIAMFISFYIVGVDIKPNEPPKPATQKEAKEANEAGLMAVSLYCFLTWGLYTFILWQSLASGDRTMLQRHLLAGEFDAKITQHDALRYVTDCIHETIPDRNATIDDFTACFRKLGMPKTIIP